MALVNSSFTVNVTPGAMPPIVHVSEYDIGRTYTVTINGENGGAFVIPTGATATIEGTLNGEIGFTTTATIANNAVSFALTESMTARSGKAWCKIKLTLNDEPIQTCAFVLAVDRAGVEADTVIGADGFDTIIQDAVDNYLEDHHIAIDPTLTISGAAADAKVTGDEIGELKSALRTTDDVIGVVNGFEGVNAAISVNKNIVTATKGSASNWYAFGVKNKPLKFMLRGVEYMIVGYGVSPNSANYVFFLAVVTNTSANFGKGYVFSQNVNTKALGTDHALTTQQIFNANAVYSANANIDYYFSGTEVTISYNGLSNTIDLSEIPVSTNLSGNFSVPMVGLICHSSVQGDSYSLEYNTALKTLDNFNQWSGKKWCAFGDSITAYGYYQPLVLSATGMGECTNMGIGGSTIAELYDGQTAAFCNRYNTIADGFDIITILGGTNDFGKNIPLGQKGSTDKKTFYGGVSALLSGIKAKFPTTPILFFAPLQRDYFGTAEEISGMVNGNGNTLRQYRDIIIDLCTDAGVPCFDLFGMSGLYPENVHQWTLDGLHPNQTFWNTHYKVISDFILKYLPTS